MNNTGVNKMMNMVDDYSVEVKIDGKPREVFAELHEIYIDKWDEIINLDWVGHFYFDDDGEVVTLPDDYVLAVDYKLHQEYADTLYRERVSG